MYAKERATNGRPYNGSAMLSIRSSTIATPNVGNEVYCMIFYPPIDKYNYMCYTTYVTFRRCIYLWNPTTIYPAILTYEDGYDIAVTFPDLPGCATCGSDEEDAMKMAKEALGGHLWCMETDGETRFPRRRG